MILHEEYISFIQQLCVISKDILLKHWQKAEILVEDKADASPVTAADRETEQALRTAIQKQYPEHGIIAEEFGNENVNAEYTWVIDPIDGTKSFISGVPLFTTLIGLQHQGKPIVGAIHQPVLDQLCIGTAEKTWLNDQAVTVRDCSSLSKATMVTSGLETFENGAQDKKAGWDTLLKKTRISRTWGDGYGYLLLASGKIDACIDPIVCPWDILPIIPIIKGAQGKITTWDGKLTESGDSAIAACPQLHAEILRELDAAS